MDISKIIAPGQSGEDEIQENGWKNKELMVNENVQLISNLANWVMFMTLTFKNPISPYLAFERFKWLVEILNKKTFGKRYNRSVGHSYFSYIVAMELQKRDVVHFHVLVDRPVDFQLVHTFWQRVAGFAWLKPIRGEKEKVISYVSKYILKGGELQYYLSAKRKTPANLPSWWK